MPTCPELATLIEQECGRARARAQSYDREADRSRGVNWSALGPDPWRPRPDTAIKAAAQAQLQRLRSWRDSASGRFLAAVADGQRAAERAHLVGETARAAVASGTEHAAAQCRAAAEALESEGRALILAARAARRALGRHPGPARDQGNEASGL